MFWILSKVVVKSCSFSYLTLSPDRWIILTRHVDLCLKYFNSTIDMQIWTLTSWRSFFLPMTTDCNHMNGGTDHLWRYDGLSENLTGSRMLRHWYRVRSSGTRIFTQTNKSVTILAPNHYTTTTTPHGIPCHHHDCHNSNTTTPKNRERGPCLHMIQVFGRIL